MVKRVEMGHGVFCPVISELLCLLLCSFSDPTSVYFGGEVRGASSIKFEDQIGSEVKHSYEVCSNAKIFINLS